MKLTNLKYLVLFWVMYACNTPQENQSKNNSFEVFTLPKISDVKPQGWIKQFLTIQKEGLTGNIESAGAPFDTKMWTEKIELDKVTEKEKENSFKRDGSNEKADKGIFWWPYEQTGYYIDGAIKSGYLLQDEFLINKGKEQIEFLLNNPMDNNRLGPAKLIGRWNKWPYTGLFRSFITEYNETNDSRIVNALHNHYSTYEAADFQDELDVCNAEHLLWLYEKTNDLKMLEMAEEAYQLFKSEFKNRSRANADMIFESDRVPDQHGVVYFEVVKIPALLYQYTGKIEYLNEAINGLQKMEKHFMLPSGLVSTTEHFHEPNEMAGHETCNHATLPYTYGIMLRVTGDSKWADKIEKAAYNAAMGSITKDFKSHQYFSAPNQVIVTQKSNHFGYYGDFMAYTPGHNVACCTGNINRFMPYFAMQMWLKTKNNGIVASLFGESEFSTTVGKKNIPVLIKQKTNYPFDEKIKFEVNLDKSAEFDFQLRIPHWCSNPEIRINGKRLEETIQPASFHLIKRKFSDGDIIELSLPMEVKVEHWFNKGVTFERGPIVYSYPVPTRTIIEEDYEKATEDFPAYSLYPNGKWNFASNINNINEIEVIENDDYSYPWDIKTPPVKLRVKVKEVENWKLTEVLNENTGEKVLKNSKFPENLNLSQKSETIQLVPYGSTLLRVTVFPTKK